ncbi:FkbM family methyltransferase [Thioalkalivibrio sp. ALJ3]|uniref:FkbM family methyltransferase n=1 Tax=Thioalkalivibrio sp. ALJ3 TaxID=1240557 RepID=UPI0009DAD13D|nr:FkbM family methyltransferase [Thioalkalivibrio sp. ALJ3]
MFSIEKKYIQDFFYRWVQGSEKTLFAIKFNLVKGVLRYRASLRWDDRAKQYTIIDDAGCKVVFPRKERLKKYKDGANARLDVIENEYMAGEVPLVDGDIVIDVGANVGEFSKALRRRAKIRVLAVEPDELEVEALKINMEGIDHEVYGVALWSESCYKEFYPGNETGDSSLFQSREDIQPLRVECRTLDEILSNSRVVESWETIKLMKLETEGAEPEVLLGAKRTLERVQFVSADVGAERGINKESTLLEVESILRDQGFEPIGFSLPRAVMLFRNRKV